MILRTKHERMIRHPAVVLIRGFCAKLRGRNFHTQNCNVTLNKSPQGIYRKLDEMLSILDLRKESMRIDDDPSSLIKTCDGQKSFTVSVEGNIASGKTTLLEYFRNSSHVEAVSEPLEQWTNVDGHNALNLLYEDPQRWSFTFNMYALLTRVQMHKTFHNKPIQMLERSLYSTLHCFVENNYRKETINGLEHAVLTEWFNWLIKTQDIKVDLIVYLRADPETCYQRIQSRSRKEECCVPLSLIQDLHTLYEEWLITKKFFTPPAPVLVLDANVEYDKMTTVYEDKRPEILFGYD